MPVARGPADEATQSFYFFGFGAGEYGAQSGHLVGFRLYRQTLYYAGAWTGQNVLRYIDGSLGPRVEAIDLAIAGLPNPVGNSVARCFGMGTGTAPGVAALSSPPTQYVWAAYSDGAPGSVNGRGGVYRIPTAVTGTAQRFAGPNIPVPQSGAGTAPLETAYWGPFLNTAGQTTAVPDFGGMIQSVSIGNTVYLTSQGNGFYTILMDPQFSGAPGVVGFVGQNNQGLRNGNTGNSFPDGYPLALYGTFMVGTSYVQPNQLLFSADGNYLSWPGTFLNVGDPKPIVGLFPTRHGLYICKSTNWPMLGGQVTPAFASDEWWLMTGTPGTGAIVRKIMDGPAATADTGVVLGDGTVGFLTSGASAGPAALQMTPAVFTGATVNDFRYLTGAGQVTPQTFVQTGFIPKVLRLRESHDWMVMSQFNVATPAPPSGFVRRDGIWSQHDFGILPLTSTNTAAVADPQNDRVFFNSVSAADNTIHIQQWSAYIDAPTTGPAATQYQQVAPAYATFSLPEWTSRSGLEVAVRYAWVDFKVWTANALPSVTCTLLPLRLYRGTDGTPLPAVFQGPSVVVNPPVRARYTFSWPMVFGDAFQLMFSNINGVSVEKIECELATRPYQA